MADPLPLLRLASLTEAVSYLVLLGIAMPLKYVWAVPQAVSVVGLVHGLLFLVLLWFLLRARFEKRWPAGRLWLLLGASFVPVWPFLLDRRMRCWIAESTSARP